jgi:hypothetical protein
MKKVFNKRKLVAIAIAASSLALLSGCGSGGNSAPVVPPPAVNPGQQGYGPGGGCIPINQTSQIPFTVTGMFIGNHTDMRVVAGQVPPTDPNARGMTGGQLLLVGNGYMQQQGYQLASFQGSRVDGTTLQLTVTAGNGYTPQPYPYPQQYPHSYAANGQYNGVGVINLSPFMQGILAQAAAQVAGGPMLPNPGTYPPGSYPGGYPNGGYPNSGQLCVSNVGISVQRTTASYANWLYMGRVYFYLNGTQHGVSIDL